MTAVEPRPASATPRTAVEQIPTAAIRTPRASTARRTLRVIGDIALRLAVLAGAGALWELIARLADTPFFPPLTEILRNAHLLWFSSGSAWADFLEMLGASLARLLPGMFFGVLAGIALGILIAKVRWAEELLYPLLQFLRAIPSSAKIPLFIAVLGLTDASKIWVIALAVALPLTMNVSDGVKNTDPTLVSMAQAYRVGRFQQLWGITLPAAAPQTFAGLRIGTTIAIIVLVLSELTGAFTGIGQFVQYASSQFKPLDMWAGVLVLGALGYALNMLLTAIEHRVLAWQRESTATAR